MSNLNIFFHNIPRACHNIHIWSNNYALENARENFWIDIFMWKQCKVCEGVKKRSTSPWTWNLFKSKLARVLSFLNKSFFYGNGIEATQKIYIWHDHEIFANMRYFFVWCQKNEELCVCLAIETIIREDNMLGDILIYASNGCL